MQNKIYVHLLGLILIIAPDLSSSQTSSYDAHVQRLKVLPETGHYQTAVKLLTDADGSIIVFCRIGLGYLGNKAFVFLKQQDEWSEAEKVCEEMVEGVISDGKLKLITVGNLIDTRGNLRDAQIPLEVFDLTNDLQISSQASLSLSLSSNQKFEKEDTRELVSVAAGEQSNSFLILGDYSASNLNPITFMGRLISAGHAGCVELPFAIQITDSKVVGFYELPIKFEDNDYVDKITGLVDCQRVHVVWIKGRNYSRVAEKVMYAQFNLDTHKWSNVSELFSGPEFDNAFICYCSTPTLVVSQDSIVHSAWSYADIQEDSQLPRGDSGVFYRNRDAKGWSSIYKIANSAANQCKLSIGKDQSVHIFWVDYQKKVYHAYKDESGWHEASVVYEDPNINCLLPFDIKVDLKGNFHLAYIRSFRAKKQSNRFILIPDELVYVKISKNRL